MFSDSPASLSSPLPLATIFAISCVTTAGDLSVRELNVVRAEILQPDKLLVGQQLRRVQCLES